MSHPDVSGDRNHERLAKAEILAAAFARGNHCESNKKARSISNVNPTFADAQSSWELVVVAQYVAIQHRLGRLDRGLYPYQHLLKTHAKLSFHTRSDCIYPDNFQAAGRTTRYLIDYGHKRILYSCIIDRGDNQNQHYSVRDRRTGCRAALQDAGLVFESFTLPQSATYGQFLSQWIEKLRSPERPTAVIGYGLNDIEIVHHAAKIVGLHVPSALSSLTFVEWDCSIRGQLITRMGHPDRLMGANAVNQLIQKN